MRTRIQESIGFTLRIAKVAGGWASQCLLEGELIGQRETFPTLAEAIADTEVARKSIIADLAANGIKAHERPRAQA